MAQKFFVDGNGKYLGAFDGGEAGEFWNGSEWVAPPVGVIEVSTPPVDGRCVWNGSSWGAAPSPPAVMPTPREWLERLSLDKQHTITAAGMGNAAIMLWLFKAMGSSQIDVTLQETKDGIAALVEAGVLSSDDQAILLA